MLVFTPDVCELGHTQHTVHVYSVAYVISLYHTYSVNPSSSGIKGAKYCGLRKTSTTNERPVFNLQYERYVRLQQGEKLYELVLLN